MDLVCVEGVDWGEEVVLLFEEERSEKLLMIIPIRNKSPRTAIIANTGESLAEPVNNATFP